MNKIALLFPGQGSQVAGMGKSVCDRFPAARHIFEEANDALRFDLQRLCCEGSLEELTKTENTQPAILTVSMAAFRSYMEETGVAPAYTAGHSLGEISALCAAGAIRFSDAVRIVRKRGRFMQEAAAAGAGSMAAVSGVEQSVIREECGKISGPGSIVAISNYNSPDQIVISGHSGAVNTVGDRLKKLGARVIPLKVSAPFHSPLMQPAADRLKEELKQYTYSDMKWAVVSNVTALPYPGTDKLVEYLAAQMVQPVQWQASMEYLQKQGVECVIEIGPKTVLKNLMEKNAPGVKAFSYDNEADRLAVKGKLSTAGQEDSNGKGIALITKCIAAAVSTKNRNWDNDEYRKGVVEPYRKIVSMKEGLIKAEVQPSAGQMKEALELLRRIFATKGMPAREQAERFNRIFEETGTASLFQDFKISG